MSPWLMEFLSQKEQKTNGINTSIFQGGKEVRTVVKDLNFINDGVKFSKNVKVCKLNNIDIVLNNTFPNFHGMEKEG
jgi:hypothetical protein